MDKLPIYTSCHSQYRVFDHSGQLPFSVVFGLCRRSSEDTESRSLILDTRRSALDVPYGLAKGLLKLNVEDADLKEETALAVQNLSQFGRSGTYVTLPSPVNREGNLKANLVTYQYQIQPNSELASIFKPGHSYQLKFVKGNLEIRWHAYGDLSGIVDGEGKPTQPKDKISLVTNNTRDK